MAETMAIAVLGAGGTMGQGIARNLARAGFEVRAWNRTREKAEPLQADGVTVVDTAEQAGEQADVVITMLADADAVLRSIRPALGAERGGREQVWVQMSTIGEAGTADCSECARELGVAFVDAPVLGTKEPAEKGELVVMASGPEEVRERLEPVFDAVGKRTMWLGEAGTGTLLKTAVNGWIVAVVEGGAETIALAEGLGLDPALVLEAIAGGPLDLPYLKMKAEAMIERDFTPSFRLALAAKDARLAHEAAERRGLPLPLFATISERLEQGAAEHGDEDLAATYLTSAPSNAG